MNLTHVDRFSCIDDPAWLDIVNNHPDYLTSLCACQMEQTMQSIQRNIAIVTLLLLCTGIVKAGDAAKADSLDGVWLFDVASQSTGTRAGSGVWFSQISKVRYSKITFTGNAFSVSNYVGSTANLTGKLILDAAGLGTVDLKADPMREASDLWEENYPACTLPGIYKRDGDRIELCFQAGLNPVRPSDFKCPPADKLLITIVKADAKFVDFPKNVAVTVVDPAGKPVPKAEVTRFMSWWISAKNPEAGATWKYSPIGSCDDTGVVEIPYEDIANSNIMAHDGPNKQLGFADASPAALSQGSVTIHLQKERILSGKIVCDELAKLNKPMPWTNVILERDGRSVGQCNSYKGEYEFHVPAGDYSLRVYGDGMPARYANVTVSEGPEKTEPPPVPLFMSRLLALKGKPAPEIKGVVGWKGSPTKFSDLKGQYVILDFWGYWCGPCVGEMPKLMAISEHFKGRGVTVIGVHLDLHGEVSTAEALDAKIAKVKQELWKGKDLPFPVALVNDDHSDPLFSSLASGQYGVTAYPTTVLIDREGNVVGSFDIYDKDKAMAELEEMLAKPAVK